MLKPGELFRRAIGRNKVALESKAGIIWFTDCDHFFGRGCLDDLWNVWKEFESPPAMVWPRTVLVHNGYQIADEFYQQYKTAFGSLIIDLNDDLFVPRKYRKAIGGVQIVRGDFANKHGYLNGQEKWMRPMPEDRPFPCFRDDAKYRNYCQHHDRIEGIDFCGLYRLRHSCVTYRGKPRGAIDEEI